MTTLKTYFVMHRKANIALLGTSCHQRAGSLPSQTRECDIVLLMGVATIDEFIDFSLEQKHRLASFTQNDRDHIDEEDLALGKPDLLRALLAPAVA